MLRGVGGSECSLKEAGGEVDVSEKKVRRGRSNA